jgi:hypothetical protein
MGNHVCSSACSTQASASYRRDVFQNNGPNTEAARDVSPAP